MAITGSRTLLIAPLKWTTASVTYAATVTTAQTTALRSHTNAMYLEASAGAFTGWTTTVAPQQTLTTAVAIPASISDLYNASLSQLTAAGFNPANYDNVMYVIADTANPAVAGLTDQPNGRCLVVQSVFTHATDAGGWTRQATANNSDLWTNAFPHELGHTLQWLHSNSYEIAAGGANANLFKAASSTLVEYGGPADTMGINWYGFDSSHRMHAGWIASGKQTIVDLSTLATGTTTYTIQALENTSATKQILRFRDPTRREFINQPDTIPVDSLDIDFRVPTANEIALNTSQTAGAMVHLTLADPVNVNSVAQAASFYIMKHGEAPAWPQGRSATTAGGHLTITATTVTASSVTITANWTKPAAPAAPTVTGVKDSFGVDVANGGTSTHNPVRVTLSVPAGGGYIIPKVDGVDVTASITSGDVHAAADNTVVVGMPSDLASGTRSFTATFVNLGGTSAASAARTWVIPSVGGDTSKPHISFNSGPAASTTATTATFTGTAGDPFDAATTLTVEWQMDGNVATWTSAGAPDSLGAWTFTVSPVTVGSHSLRIRARDPAGNISLALGNTWNWTVTAVVSDTTAPTTTITSTPPASTTSLNATFAFTATDPDDTALQITSESSLDGAAYVTRTSPFTVPVTVGSHTMLIRSRDAANNVETPAVSYTWTVTATPPSLAPTTTITSGPPAASPTTTADFTWTVSDPDDPAGPLLPGPNVILQPHLTLDQNLVTEMNLDNAGWVIITDPPPLQLSGLAFGAHTLLLRSWDPAGHAEASPAAWSWSVTTTDANPPTTTITQAPPASTQATSATFAFVASDPEGNPTTTQVSIDGGAFITRTSPFTVFALAVGAHTADFVSTDAAGNAEAAPPSVSWTVAAITPTGDTTPPTTIITSGPADGAALSVDTATFGFAATDPDDSAGTLVYQVQIDGGAWVFATSPYTATNLSNGSHIFSVRAQDAAGNVEPSPPVRGFTVSTVGAVTGSGAVDVTFFLNTTSSGAGSTDVTFFLNLHQQPPGSPTFGCGGRPAWAALCGVEFANLARVREYLRNGLGGGRWEVTDAPPCSVLYRLGTDTYTSPAADGAPWIDALRPESLDFLGVTFDTKVLVEVLGSVATRSVADIATRFGGAAIGPMRRGARSITFDAQIIAASQAGASYGLAWLSQVLNDTALCDPCSLCSLELRTSCPPDDGSNDEQDHWVFYDVACTAGPTPSDSETVDDTAILPVTFTLTMGKPYRYKPLATIVAPTMLRKPSTATGCMSFDQWLCGQDDLSTITTPLPAPRVGTLGTRVTLAAAGDVGPIAVELYDSCPAIPVDPSQSRGGMVVTGLAAGEGFILDSSLHLARKILADGTVTDGAANLAPVVSGEPLTWAEIESCDASACLVVRGLHPCSGGEDTAVSIEAQRRES